MRNLKKKLTVDNFNLTRGSAGTATIAARQSEMVNARLANGYNLGVAAQFAQLGGHIVWRRREIIGVPTYHSIHRSMRIGQAHSMLTTLKVSAYRDDACDAGRLCAFDQAGNILREIRESEMRVCVVERFH